MLKKPSWLKPRKAFQKQQAKTPAAILPKGWEVDSSRATSKAAVICKTEGATSLTIYERTDGTFCGEIEISHKENPFTWRCGNHKKPRYAYNETTEPFDSLEKVLLHLVSQTHLLDLSMMHLDSLYLTEPSSVQDADEKTFLIAYQNVLHDCIQKDSQHTISLDTEHLEFMDLDVADILNDQRCKERAFVQGFDTWAPLGSVRSKYGQFLWDITHPKGELIQ